VDDAAPDRTHWLELPAHRASVPVARHTMGEHLDGWRLPADVCANAALLLSELATNAVLHTLSSRFLCGIGLLPGSRLRLEVHDQDATHRAPGTRTCPGPTAENGRGLLLVHEIAETWGVDRSTLTGGNAVWATLTTAV
jgi:anti-sigma regulatory factor (Ser/Thr protein kinase)